MSDSKNPKRGISLSVKLGAGYLGSAMVAAAVVALAAYLVASVTVEGDVETGLKASAQSQKHGLDAYFETVEADLDFLSSARLSVEGLAAFGAGWAGEEPQALQRAYIDDNPNPLGSKHLLDRAAAETAYNQAHATFHGSFRTFLEVRGYYDIFLISEAGDIIYSVFKERDYATNLQTGEFKNSGLGDVFRKALSGDNRAMVDFLPYAPSYDAPAAFVAAPVRDASGRSLGVVALQIPADRIAAAVAAGEGFTSFVVGEDGSLRTDLAETEGADILERTLESDFHLEAAGSEQAIVHRGNGILGDDAIISALSADVFGKTWFIISETPAVVAYKPLADLQLTLIATVLPIMLLLGCVSAYLARGTSHAIGNLASAMRKVVAGHLSDEVPGLQRRDEIGQMADALRVFKENAAIQLAVTAAVQSNTTAMLVIDNHGDVITQNASFTNLWAQNEATLRKLTTTSRFNSGDMLNFAPLVAEIKKQEAVPGALKIKRNGEQALDLQINTLIIEVKSSAIVDQNGRTLGASIELADVTAIRKIETELIDVIDGVKDGKFDGRITSIDSFGFSSLAAEGLNNVMEAIGSFMGELESSLSALANGDLTREITLEFKGDFKLAAERFNASMASLRETMQNVQAAASSVRSAADPIATGSSELASRAVSQATTLKETAETMEDMSTRVRQNADKAEKGTQLSSRASELARDGGTVVSETISAMGKIEESSSKISDITDVIEGIAFQTNLLALNAAVEAARAGDAGKGFAVVASEVRTLAQRSSEASQDIKNLISAGAEHVSAGVSLVNKTGSSLETIVEAVQSVVEMISDIATSVNDQATSVNEITATVAQLDQVTQSDSALADQSATAARGLHDAASELTELIDAFRINEKQGRSRNLAA